MKPFLKWAGNKYRLLANIQTLLPHGKRLIEPFVGSGAVFLNLDFPDYLLNDSNADLINLFKILTQQGTSFIQDCKKYFTPKYNTQDAYNRLRIKFNTTTDPYEKSRLFIYLNRHGYNGLCRYNNQGIFNVPFGRYAAPVFPDKQLLNFHQRAQAITFHCCDFRTIFQMAQPGDVIYCDPPYVASSLSKPIQYQTNGFEEADQAELAHLAQQTASKGIPVVISNHDTPYTRQIYHQAKCVSLKVTRTISCKGAQRSPAKELLALFD